MSFPKPHKTTLPNGLRILVVPMKETATVTVQVLVGTGSNYETKDTNGISHFLEHLCFKGTKRRLSATGIAHEFAAIGAQNNAFTGEEVTGYWAKARTKHFDQILDIVSDIYLNPTLPEAEIEKEKGVIIEEINMYEDQPQSVVSDAFDALVYGDQPAGWTILGPKKNILRMTRNEVEAYRNTHYIPSKTVVVISGGVSTRDAVRSARKAFSHVTPARTPKKPSVVEKQSKPALVVKTKQTEQSHFILGFRSYKTHDKRDITTAVLSTVLGGGMSSRLFSRLREDMGVCYYVKSRNSSGADTGIFQIRAGVDSKRLEEVVTVVMEEVRKLRNELIGDKELKKAQEVILGAIAMGLESSDALADWYGMDEVIGKKLETPESISKKIKAVTAHELQKIAKDIFVNAKLNFAVVGPHKNEAVLKTILKV